MDLIFNIYFYQVKINGKQYCVKESRGGFHKERQHSIFEQALFLSRLEHENVLGILYVAVDVNEMPLIITARDIKLLYIIIPIKQLSVQ